MDESDLRLTRLVARHYTDMQGLRDVAGAVCLSPVAVAYLVTGSDAVAIVSMLLALVAMGLCMGRLDHYYADRFGRVAPSSGKAHAVWMAVTIFGLTFPDQHTSGWPSLFCLSWAGWCAWLAWDGWPDRRHYVFVAGVMALASVFHTQVPAGIDFKTWFAQTMLLLNASLVVVGIADHMLLVRLLSARDGAAATELHDHTV